MAEQKQRSAANANPVAAFAAFLPLAPLIIGLGTSRAGAIVASYGSYTRTDEGIFSDGSILVSLGILAIFLLVIAKTKRSLSARVVNGAMIACVVTEAVALFSLSLYDAASLGPNTFLLRFGLCSLCNLATAGGIFYWLRLMKGSGAATAIVFAFSALIVSEIELYACTLLPPEIAKTVAGALALTQLPCMLKARQAAAPFVGGTSREGDYYFTYAKTVLSSKQFLIATAIGIGFLCVVIGILRGYPDGDSIGFTPATRLADLVLTIVLGLIFIARALRRKRHTMTTFAFVTMEALGCLALLCYAAFPGALDIGAVFTTTLNAIMMTFTWYVIIAFSTSGWRDPYYYAIAGQLIWLGSRAVARVVLLLIVVPSGNEPFMLALIGALIVLSTQVILLQLLGVMGRQHREREEVFARLEAGVSAAAAAPAEGVVEGAVGNTLARKGVAENAGNAVASPPEGSMLLRIMGLDEAGSMADTRQAAMQHSIEELGRQFLLSEREVEVLTLYAQGFTQKRVAEELFISQGTAHAHIKRIYAKTGLHSRQEVLDYLQKYTS